MIFATAGTSDGVRDLGLTSPILLDDGLAGISKAFGAPGTPSAVLVDADGHVASNIIVGGDAILDFLDEQAESGGGLSLDPDRQTLAVNA